jgi:hypothetical protein
MRVVVTNFRKIFQYFQWRGVYTTYLGWQQYEVLFTALWQTGLLYLGFLMVGYRFLKNVLAPAGSTHHAAEHALNNVSYG